MGLSPAHPPLTAAEELRFRTEDAAVVVVDAQNDFCHPQGLLAQQGRDVARVQPALQQLASFLGDARAVGVPVIFVQNLHDESSDSPAWLARHSDSGRAQSCQAGTWGAEFCGVGPVAGDHVVSKHRYSAFIGTTFTDLLDRLGRRSLLFTGFTTSVCVESSLRDAVCLDLLATLVEDCCGAYSPRAHERAVESVALGFGVVATSDRIRTAWGLTTEPPSPGAQVSEVAG